MTLALEHRFVTASRAWRAGAPPAVVMRRLGGSHEMFFEDVLARLLQASPHARVLFPARPPLPTTTSNRSREAVAMVDWVQQHADPHDRMPGYTRNFSSSREAMWTPMTYHEAAKALAKLVGPRSGRPGVGEEREHNLPTVRRLDRFIAANALEAMRAPAATPSAPAPAAPAP